MDISANTETVAGLIQLSLVPVFLLVGIGQIMNVVTGRLARIIDRSRWYESQSETTQISRFSQLQCHELIALRRRMRCANWSINFLTAAALLVCCTVILLLINGIVVANLENLVLSLFMFAMAAITGGLICFFIEVSVASATLKIPYADDVNKKPSED